MGAIVVVGLGIRGPAQVTDEAQRCLARADVVLHSVADPSVRAWLETIAPETRDLNELYVDGRPRIEAYRAMAEHVLRASETHETVALAVYGHPCVLHTGVQLTLRGAAERAIPTTVLPGISSIDGLLAALGVDFGFGGLHVLEASDMLLHARMPQTDGHVVILQVAITGPRLHRADGHRGAHADYLLRRLRTLYPPEHAALHFRLAASPTEPDSLRWTTVARLSEERWTNASSLYLPPARPSRPDPIYAQRFDSGG